MSSIDSRSSSPIQSTSEEEQSYSHDSSPTQSIDDDEHSYDDDEDPPPEKRIKHDPNGVDRLSNLPDALIALILTLIPSNEAIQTQLISKRWRYAWASIPSLTFSQDLLYKDFTPTNQLITNSLLIHKGPLRSLSLLRLDCYGNGFGPPIKIWVESAVNKGIEVLVLSIDGDGHESSFFLPRCFYNCDSLVEFRLSAYHFDLGRCPVYWKSLKKLSLCHINNLSNAKIDKIIESSPELDLLDLSNCSGFNRIRVSNPDSKLRNLVINDADALFEGEFLEISGPCIESLEISGYMGDRHCRLLGDMSSLVRVKFRFRMRSSFWNCVYDNNADKEHNRQLNENRNLAKLIKCQRTLLQLLDKTSHVEVLSLGNWCTQILSLCELGNKPTLSLSLSLKCKTLEIDLLKERSVPGIAGLLRSSPYLEKLIIHMQPYELEYKQYYEVDSGDFSGLKGENYWKSVDEVSVKNLWLHHIKVVEFIGPCDDTTEKKLVTELAEYVLGRAKVLEKLVLNPGERVYRRRRHSDLRKSGLFYVIQKLFNYPRCSPQARVLLV